MNIALIFAGGTGQRMNSKSKPKQFLELYGKPIIVYTLEYFESHEEIDAICIVCVRGWEKELKRMLIKNDIHKVRWITEGGSTGHDSIFNGLKVLEKDCDENDIILIHDAVRPLISKQLISENLEIVKKYGNAITVESARESVIGVGRNRSVKNVPARDLMRIAKAPQSFYLKDILEVHRLAEKEQFKSIDSVHLMNHYGRELYTVESTPYNIKITTPADYYVFRALTEVKENSQIFGI